jgi:hypothetical protein
VRQRSMLLAHGEGSRCEVVVLKGGEGDEDGGLWWWEES